MSVRLKLPDGRLFKVADGRFLLIAGLSATSAPDLDRAAGLVSSARPRLPLPVLAGLAAPTRPRLAPPARVTLEPPARPEIRS